jgi:hypothetical protein
MNGAAGMEGRRTVIPLAHPAVVQSMPLNSVQPASTKPIRERAGRRIDMGKSAMAV